MQYIRSKLFDVFFVLWTLLLSPSLPVLWMLGTPKHSLRYVSQLWVRGLLFGLKHIVRLGYVERGRENIPDYPCIIIANHQSLWETIALAAIFPTAAFVAKQEINRFPVVGWFVRNYPMIMIDRGGRAQAVRKLVEESRAALDAGRPIIMFPEGTRKSVSERVSFRRGVESLYAELHCPILPIALNSGAFWGRDRPFKYNGTITVSYLPPIMPGLDPKEFKLRAETGIQNEKERLVKDLDVEP